MDHAPSASSVSPIEARSGTDHHVSKGRMSNPLRAESFMPPHTLS